jgi:hypothetical protein
LVMIEHGTFREVDWTLNGRWHGLVRSRIKLQWICFCGDTLRNSFMQSLRGASKISLQDFYVSCDNHRYQHIQAC